jgi:hypothetical protein
MTLALGNALQDARSTLDYLAWELGTVGAKEQHGREMTPKESEHSAFPVCTSSSWFDKEAKKKLATVTPEAVADIKGLQPIKNPRDSHPLYLLHELARWDRHRFSHFTLVRTGDIRLDPRLSSNVDLAFLVAEEGDIQIIDFEARTELAHLSATPLDPSKEMNMHFDRAFTVAFDPDTPLIGERPVVDVMLVVLTWLTNAVKQLENYLPPPPRPYSELRKDAEWEHR